MTANYVLITGATSGLGYALAKQFINEGWKVVGVGHDLKKLNKTQEDLGAGFIALLCDVGDVDKVRQSCTDLKEHKILPKICILNAGIGDIEPADNLSISQHRKVFDVNYFGAVAWVSCLLPHDTSINITFVAIGSILVKHASPFARAYCASKSALVSAFQSLRHERWKTGTRFVTVLPGPIQTKMLKADKPVPFVMSPEYAAKHIAKKLKKGKDVIVLPRFYRGLFAVLQILPEKFVRKILGF